MRTATARTLDRPTVTPTPDIRKLRELAKAQESHTRSCKRPLDGCSTCRDTVRWFAGLPLDVLSQVLEDRPTSRVRQ